jgi:hypothetical protein
MPEPMQEHCRLNAEVGTKEREVIDQCCSSPCGSWEWQAEITRLLHHIAVKELVKYGLLF